MCRRCVKETRYAKKRARRELVATALLPGEYKTLLGQAFVARLWPGQDPSWEELGRVTVSIDFGVS